MLFQSLYCSHYLPAVFILLKEVCLSFQYPCIHSFLQEVLFPFSFMFNFFSSINSFDERKEKKRKLKHKNYNFKIEMHAHERNVEKEGN